MKIIFFDFDGVLVNTTELNFKLHKNVNGNLTLEKFKEFSEGNFHKGIGKAIKEDNYVIPNNYSELYENGLSEINIHNILRDTILHLKDKYKLAIISSTGSLSISNFLKREGLDEYFDDILGSDINTDKTDKIKSILEKYNIVSKDAVFITDTLGDIIEAEKCGVRSIGVTWGLHGRETLEKGNPVTIIDDPRDLENAINNVLK